MGLLDKFKKRKETAEPATGQQKEQVFQQDLSKEADSLIRPGGVFMVQLLMKERCEMPSNERLIQVLSKHLGNVEQFGSRGQIVNFAAHDYIAKFRDASMPVTLMISDCDEFAPDSINDFQRSQMWDCINDRERILTECKYQITANDMLGGGLPSKVRANMLMDYLEALVELYPECEAVYLLNSGKMILADDIRKNAVSGIGRFIKFAVNARFFNIQGTEDSIVDTLGLSLLYIEDLQYHFHDMDPNWVVNHACNMALYLLENDRPIKDGDTIDGIRDGMIVQDIQWKCQYEDALVQPARPVMDVCMGEYAAGERR